MKAFAIAVLAAVLGVGAALSGIGRPQDARGGSNQDQSKRTITVTGNGSVRAVPDSAQFSFGVTTQAVSAADALRSNASLARKVIAAVKGAGVPDADVQTETVFLTPRLSDEGSLIVGYTATNAISTALRDLSKTGTVVDAAVEAGATDVSGPSLTGRIRPICTEPRCARRWPTREQRLNRSQTRAEPASAPCPRW